MLDLISASSRGRGDALSPLFASLNITTHLRHCLLFGPLTHNALHFFLNLQFMSDTALRAILLNNWPPQPCRGFWWVSKHKLIHKSRVPVAGRSLCLMWPECIKLSKMLSSSQEVRIITCWPLWIFWSLKYLGWINRWTKKCCGKGSFSRHQGDFIIIEYTLFSFLWFTVKLKREYKHYAVGRLNYFSPP